LQAKSFIFRKMKNNFEKIAAPPVKS